MSKISLKWFIIQITIKKNRDNFDALLWPFRGMEKENFTLTVKWAHFKYNKFGIYLAWSESDLWSNLFKTFFDEKFFNSTERIWHYEIRGSLHCSTLSTQFIVLIALKKPKNHMQIMYSSCFIFGSLDRTFQNLNTMLIISSTRRPKV